MSISKITLRHASPHVFSDADLSASMVWRKDIAFDKGKIYMVEAESGAGKSSLCSFIYGNRNDYDGQILFDDTDIRTLRENDWVQIRRRAIAILPQDLRLFPELTAIENIQIKNRLTNYKSEKEIMDMLGALEIDNKANSLVAHLSIGQQQRVAIIRALCQPMDFLLLDEPVSHLDPRNNLTAARLILDEAHRQGAALIATSVGNPLMIDIPYNAFSL